MPSALCFANFGCMRASALAFLRASSYVLPRLCFREGPRRCSAAHNLRARLLIVRPLLPRNPATALQSRHFILQLRHVLLTFGQPLARFDRFRRLFRCHRFRRGRNCAPSPAREKRHAPKILFRLVNSNSTKHDVGRWLRLCTTWQTTPFRSFSGDKAVGDAPLRKA